MGRCRVGRGGVWCGIDADLGCVARRYLFKNKYPKK